MHKKLFYLILLLCFFKLFHVAYKSVQFSPNILFNSFKRNVAEKSSLGFASNDVIPLRNFFLDRNISEFTLSKKIIEDKDNNILYMSIIEFNYPIKLSENSPIFIAYKNEKVESKIIPLKGSAHIGLFSSSYKMWKDQPIFGFGLKQFFNVSHN